MSFIQTLINKTNQGELDSAWKYNEGKHSYSLSIVKNPFNGLYFDSTLTDLVIVFPNGSVLKVAKDNLSKLLNEVTNAVLRYQKYLIDNIETIL